MGSWEHYGPCLVDLDIRIAGCFLSDGEPLTVRFIADRALEWSTGLDEFVDELVPAKRALAQSGPHAVAQGDFLALATIMREFVDYANACGYADDDTHFDDMIVGRAVAGGNTWLYCCRASTRTDKAGTQRSLGHV